MSVSGLVCTILVDLKFFMPLPVSTLAAWISTSETSVARSGANVRVATACCLTNFGECRHILDDVHFLNARWIEVSESQMVQTLTTQVRVAASVQKTPSQIS